jgi:uncharacterized protein YkwD
MAATQAHREYQASIVSVTHTGAGGTRARDRAVAAGYGGGATVNVSKYGIDPYAAIIGWA